MSQGLTDSTDFATVLMPDETAVREDPVEVLGSQCDPIQIPMRDAERARGNQNCQLDACPWVEHQEGGTLRQLIKRLSAFRPRTI